MIIVVLMFVCTSVIMCCLKRQMDEKQGEFIAGSLFVKRLIINIAHAIPFGLLFWYGLNSIVNKLEFTQMQQLSLTAFIGLIFVVAILEIKNKVEEQDNID